MSNRVFLVFALAVASLNTGFCGTSPYPCGQKAEVAPCLAVYNDEGQPSGYRPPFFLEPDHGVFFLADLLYLQATVDGLTFAWTFPEDEPPISADNLIRSTPIPNGRLHDVDFEWSPGLRLGVGYHSPMDHWDLFLSWTHLKNESTGSVSVPNLTSNSNFGIWMPFGFLAGTYNARDASAKWKFNYNTIDLDLARASFAVKSIVFEPFLGMRGAFIHQSLHAKYQNGAFHDGTSAVPNVSFTGKNLFNGWGIHPGLKTSWHFLRDWSLYANTSASFLYGRFMIQEIAQTTSAPVRDLFSERDRYFNNALGFELGVGLKWEMFLCPDRWHLQFSAGYEMIQWFDQNQLVNFFYIDNAQGMGPYVNGDLGIQGVNVSGRFDF